MVHADTIVAANAVQQLPKILHALSNMARRTRRQFERRGIFLGGLGLQKDEISKPRGILKTHKSPTIGQLSNYNEFWKTFSHSFVHDLDCKSESKANFDRACIPYPPFQHGDTLCNQLSFQNGVYRPQTIVFLEAYPPQVSNLLQLKAILLTYLRQKPLSSQDQEILLQLQYLRVLFNVQIHKLLRKRPKEFVLPLPRKASRAASAHAKSLTSLQSVRNLPNQEYRYRWLCFNSSNYNNNFLGNDPPRVFTAASVSSKQRQRFYSTTIPKGVGFLTYPDLTDETSFEGTIGGRSIISWEKGTRFPQMGIDQSPEFRSKKEMGRQQMVQSRIRGVRRSSSYCNSRPKTVRISAGNEQQPIVNRRSLFYTPKKKAFPHKVYHQNKNAWRTIKASSTRNCQCNSWLKSCRRKSINYKLLQRDMDAEGESNSILVPPAVIRPPTPDELLQRLQRRRRAVERAECRKRMRMCFMTAVGYLSCGIVPYIIKGDCIFMRKKNLRTIDSTERCPVPPVLLRL